VLPRKLKRWAVSILVDSIGQNRNCLRKARGSNAERLPARDDHDSREPSSLFAGGDAEVYPGTQAGLCGRDLEGARDQCELYVAPVPRESFPWRVGWRNLPRGDPPTSEIWWASTTSFRSPARHPFEYLRASGGNHSISVRRFTSEANYSTSHRTQRSLRTVRASVEINELHTVRLP
jgi:hypothetical protein